MTTHVFKRMVSSVSIGKRDRDWIFTLAAFAYAMLFSCFSIEAKPFPNLGPLKSPLNFSFYILVFKLKLGCRTAFLLMPFVRRCVVSNLCSSFFSLDLKLANMQSESKAQAGWPIAHYILHLSVTACISDRPPSGVFDEISAFGKHK